MNKIILCGYNGKMGEMIKKAVKSHDDFEIVAGVDKNILTSFEHPVYDDINACKEEADLIIDFSSPLATKSVANYAKENNIALVEATTGLNKEQLNYLRDAALKTRVLQSGNTSQGLNIILKYGMLISEFLGTNDWEYEIIEKHHNRKVDAPSGAAIMIANAINEGVGNTLTYIYDRSNRRAKRDRLELGISSIRGGDIVGDHTLLIINDYEILELHHTAFDRMVFANGSLKAAEFILNANPGKLYTMQDAIDGHQRTR